MILWLCPISPIKVRVLAFPRQIGVIFRERACLRNVTRRGLLREVKRACPIRTGRRANVLHECLRRDCLVNDATFGEETYFHVRSRCTLVFRVNCHFFNLALNVGRRSTSQGGRLKRYYCLNFDGHFLCLFRGGRFSSSVSSSSPSSTKLCFASYGTHVIFADHYPRGSLGYSLRAAGRSFVISFDPD